MASRRTPSTSDDNSPRCCDTKLQDLGLNCHKNVSRGWTLTTRSMGVVKGREGNLKCTKSDLVCRDSSSPHTCDIISLHWLSGLNRNILLSERNSSLLCVCVCVQLFPTLCNPKDLPGSSIHGIFQTRILEWVAISYSKRSSWSRDWTWVSCIGRLILYTVPLGKPGKFTLVPLRKSLARC